MLISAALREKVKASPSRCDEAVASIAAGATQVVEAAEPAVCNASAADARILGEALEGRAELFVTGDQEILRLKSIARMRIVSPRELWDALRSEREA